MKKKAQTQDNKKVPHANERRLERKERKKRKKTEKNKRKQLLKKFFREKTEEKSNASREQGSGPSEDRVGENTGTRPTFSYSFFLSRSFVRFSLSLSSFFFLLCVCVFTKKMQQQQQQQNEIGKNGDLSSLGTDFEMCLTRLLTSLSLSLSL